MKKSKGMQLGAMLVAMLLVSLAFAPMVSAQIDTKGKKEIHNAQEMDELVKEISKYKKQGKNVSSLLEKYNVTQETYSKKVFRLQRAPDGHLEPVNESNATTQGGDVTTQSGDYADLSVYIHQVSIGSGWATVDADWNWSSVETWGNRGSDDVVLTVVDLDWYPDKYVLTSRNLGGSGTYWGGVESGVVAAYTPDTTTSGWMVIELQRVSPDTIGQWTQVDVNYHHTYSPFYQSITLGLNAGSSGVQGSVSITLSSGGQWSKGDYQSFQIQ